MPSSATITVLGHVAAEVTCRETHSGEVAAFSIPVNSGKRGTDSEHTDWYRISCWGLQSRIAKDQISKGTLVLVIGSLSGREYQDKSGQTKMSLDVNCRELVVISGRKERSSEQPERETREQMEGRKRRGDPAPQSKPAEEVWRDDDIPF